MVRKVISVFLSLMILSQSVIRYVPVEAANESSDESAALLTQHDQQEVDNLTQDRYIQTDVTYYGVSVNSANGKKIIVESGSLFISQNSVVNVDIELRGKAVLIIEGTVNATVTISTTSSPSASAIPSAQNGQNNFELHSQGVVQEIVLNQRFGMGRIEGSVDHLTFHANAGGTVVLSSSANIDTIDYHSTANTIQNMTGNIARLNIFSGSVNLDQATVTTVVRRDYANLTIQPSGSVVTLISKNTGEGQGRTTTAGHVNTLYAEKAPTTNTGYIKNAFISNAEYDAHRDSRYGLVQPYLTENIFAHGAMLIMRGAATVDSTIADPTDRSNVGTLHLYNSSMDLGNINIEQTHITGELNDSHFLNVAIGKLYFEATQDNAVEKLNLTQTSNVSAAFIEMSKEVYDLNFDAAVALMVVDKSSTINIQEANKKKAEDWFKANITESAGIARNNETDTFSVALTEGDTVQITLASVFGLAVAVVTDQNGEVVFAAGGNNAASTNQFIADSTGTYTITRLSNGYGATLSTQKIERSRIHINAKVATNHTHDTPEQAEAINFKEFTYTVTNPNTNDSVPFILSKDGTLSLSNEYNGVSLDLKAKHHADTGKNVWAWQQTSTSFTPGSDTSITFTARQNGQAYGKTAQRVDDLRVYIYNADGNYVGAAQTSSDDNNTSFTTNPLPTGKYALVLIRDIGGNFNYQNISDFRKNNLRDSVDYVQYNFTSEHGIMESFLDIKVPRGPFMELSGFDEKTRYYAKETAAPVGTNIEFCLSYGFSDDAKDHMTDMSAVLLFTDNCTLLGDWEGQGNTITIPLDMNQDELSVIVRLNEGGEYVLSSAVIHYKYDGEARSVSLGTASCESIAISIVSPSATAHSNVPIRGFAVPNSIVTIYDNNVPYAQI
ncbi:MAG: hypothetical protein LBM69_07635, partial [Lachnospiraceae bacterium]|nr:hypothetical protein [Lachnospiraceae bacterium]